MRTYQLFPRGNGFHPVLLVLLSVLAAACGDAPTQSHTPPAQTPAAVASIEVAPETYILPVGTHRLFGAAARGADGTLLEKYAFEWSSSDPAIATVDASGNVVAHRPGNVVISAWLEGKQGRALVQVPAPPPSVATVEVQPGDTTLRPGQTHKLWAVVRAADGTLLPGKSVTWASNSGAVKVDSTGRVQAVGMGSALVTATSEGRTGAVIVTVEMEGPVMTTYQLASVDGVSLGERYAGLDTTRVWVNGASHPAQRMIVGGVLRVTMQNDGNPTYEQELLIATYLLDTPGESVEERIRTDRGTVAYDWNTGDFVFHSATYAGLVIPSTRTAAGIDTRQRTGGDRPEWTFGWVREE